MKAVVQRVTQASLTCEGKLISQISNGLVIYFGVGKGDDESKAEYLSACNGSHEQLVASEENVDNAQNAFTDAIKQQDEALGEQLDEILTKNRDLIIPGKVAVLKGDIEDNLPGWNVIIGTDESMEIPKFLRDYKAKQDAALANA
jgi:hypothetical protein